MVSPISSSVIARASTRRTASPLTMVLVVPKIEIMAAESDDITIAAPENQLTRITASNELSQLGSEGFARAAYDEIELGAVVDVFVLPFEVDRATNTVAQRLPRVVAALDAMETEAERSKLPHGTCDIILLPRETALGDHNAANPAFTKLASTRAAFEAIGICDAGPINDGAIVAGTPSLADVQIWETNNVDNGIVAVTNRGNVAGYDGMMGSVIYAAHWAEVTSLPGEDYGIGAQPSNLRDVVRGVHGIDPRRSFSETDGSSEAVVLRNAPNHLTSIITWNGQTYMWGGRTQWPENDARTYVSNELIANRIVKEARRDLAPYLQLRGTRRRLSGMQAHVENDLRATYQPGAVESITVVDPLIEGGHVRVRVLVGFYDFIETVELVAELFTGD